MRLNTMKSAVLTVALLGLVSCGGSGGEDTWSDADGGAPDTDAGTGGSGPSLPTLRYPNTVPTPTTGAYWDIAEYDSGFGITDFMGYRLELGEPVTIDGIEGFEVNVTLLWQDYDGAEPPSQFRYLSFANHAIRRRGANDSEWHVAFSEYGSFEGVMFFSIFDDHAAYSANPRALDGEFISDPGALALYESVVTDDCEYYPEIGQTICDGGGSSGGSESAVGIGYYAPGVGFLGHYQHNCIAEGCLTTEFAVVRHSLTGPAPDCSELVLPDGDSAAAPTQLVRNPFTIGVLAAAPVARRSIGEGWGLEVGQAQVGPRRPELTGQQRLDRVAT